jgi:hypothetical protein
MFLNGEAIKTGETCKQTKIPGMRSLTCLEINSQAIGGAYNTEVEMPN